MEKLLVTLMVLGLCSVSSAVPLYYQSGTGSVDVMENTTITINIVSDLNVNTFLTSTAITASGTTFSNVALGSVTTLFTLSRNAGVLRNGSVADVWITGETGAVNTLESHPAVTAGTVLGTFTLTVGAAGGTITIKDYAGSNFGPPTSSKYTPAGGSLTVTDMPDLVLNVIPEPVTIALLGLGGLFLRRRMA